MTSGRCNGGEITDDCRTDGAFGGSAWLVLLGTYAWMLWRTRRRVSKENWIERGIVLGALGGLLGFMTSGVVHYNWGDSEVVMVFYFIMGLCLVVDRTNQLMTQSSVRL